VTVTDISLQNYAFCPSGTPARCKFTPKPVVRGPDDQAVYRCGTCGLGVTRPAMPDPSGLYDDRTSQSFLPYDTWFADRLKRIAFRKTARAIVSRVPPSPNLWLDFGCGNGALTSAFAAEMKDRASVVGMDFFEHRPPKIGSAQYVGYSQMSAFSEQADIVTCFHVVEHDDNAPAFLSRLKSLLRPGGLLVVEVPNIDCIWTPWFGKNCDNWSLPFHRLHFSRSALRQALEAAGLKVVSEENVLAASTANSLARLLGLPFGGVSFLAALMLYPLQWILEKVSQRTSGLRIYAIKP
jgi:ubiquinone/menaquinone biosynthesis C-methylase UbiE